MDAERYQHLRRLVHEAGLRPVAERSAWLEAQGASDPALVAAARALLEGDGEATAGLLGAAATPPLPAWSLAPGTALGPYVLGAELGRGGMGVVHEALAPGRSEPVAVKVILPHLLGSSAAHERFRREARLGLSIEHPHVVRALDVGAADVDGQRFAFLVMERVRGRTFRHLVQQLGALPEAWVRELVAQAAEGLAALHAAGIVHRDLKPENLILTDDRRVRVMDLGVAKSAESSAGLTAEGLFLGSPAYAAPEQCQGRSVGPAADLYALGIVLYELAAGHPPFAAREALALLRAHVDEIPPPLNQGNPALSTFLTEVAARLLAKRPEERFASAAQLAEALRSGEEGAWWQAHALVGRRLTAHLGGARTLPLVGRQHELEALRAAWRAARAGAGATLLLEAEAGLGSTRLLAELLHEASAQAQSTSLHAACGVAAASLAPVDALLEHLGPGPLATELARRLGLSPEAAERLATQLAHLPLGPGQTPLPAASVDGLLTRLARSLAADTPLLWVVEDLHAADAEQQRQVLALARAAPGRPLLLIVSARPELDPAVRAQLLALPSTTMITLQRLDHEEVARLFEAAVGDAGMARRLARVLGPRADGVPLFALEMLRDIERRAPAGQGLSAEEPTREATPPRALRDLVHARLAEVPTELRPVLEAAAVAGREVDPALVAAALGRERVEVLEALGALERRYALLRSGPRLFRFDLSLVRETVQAEVPHALRAAIHDRIADALAMSAELPEGERAARVAGHRLRGARALAARDTLAPALAHLSRAGRTAERAELLQLALEVPGLLDGPTRFDRLLDLAVDLGRMGQRQEESRVLEQAQMLARTLGDRRRQALAALQVGYLLLRTGEFERLRIEARAMRPPCAGDPKLESEAVGLEGKALWCLGRYDEARARHEEALALAARAPNELPRARVRADLAIVLQEQGLCAEALEHQQASLEVLRAHADRRNVASAMSDTANTLLTLGRVSEALPLFEEALAIARHDGLLGTEANVLINIAELHTRVGRLESAREALDACLGLTLETGERRVEGYALHGLGRLLAWQGEHTQAKRRFEAALTLRRTLGNLASMAETLLELGQRDLAAGEHADARAHLEEAVRLAEQVGDVSTAALAWATLARVDPKTLERARAARAAAGERLRMDARLEVASLLHQASGDPHELAHARRLLAEQLALVPEAWRTSLSRRVPYAAVLR